MKRLLLIFVMLALVLTACSKDESQRANAKPKEPKTEESKQAEKETKAEKQEESYTSKEVSYYEIAGIERELTELEQEMLRHPGIFSGDNYDETKVKEALDQLPDNLTEEQYVEELKYLFTEDYHEELETLLTFDSTIEVDIDRPDETVNAPTLITAHYAILVDASGSMAAKVGGKTRMEAAKEAVMEFAEQIPENATISLRVYGHKGSNSNADKALSCDSSEVLYNNSFEEEGFQNALAQVRPVGWTPIALGLQMVKGDIPEGTDDVVVYVVSDGIETCDGDPVQEAKNLVSADIQTVVNIIGFDVDNEGQKLLKEVANAGNGEFTYVNSEQDLKKYMRAQYEEIQKRWYEWKEAGKTQAYEMKGEKKKLAYDTKESMKEKSYREKERMKEAQAYLKERFEDYDHPTRKIFSDIVDYGNSKWRYAVDNGNRLWREAVDNGNREWREYVDEGNQKIRETIDKKNGN
ncbi:VWA domain-containing protein [Fredinandcohnia sp. QZ13]|uniref:VWA domain-containing protein n=1 Tax=Fredinandcohnia sp. QZ13 TaxID=3073144 RepID=UPI0028531A08|nr:VWA domain-containing protein [Fredinandcohnia sp. QZ13]MDR4890054.1 VWA domain-containing protein [Fredinandcohnia sp. QZ13]